MSFPKRGNNVYRVGCIQPSDPFPMARRAALMLEKKPAATGVEAEVPDVPANFELRSVICCVLYILASKDTSGYPLPPALYPPYGLFGETATSSKYFLTAAS